MVYSYLWSQHADIAQQAFSAEAQPTLHNALPEIEKMYSAWQKASEKPRYKIFKPALEAAMAKLDEYYQRTAKSDAHIIAMGMFLGSYIWYLLIIKTYKSLTQGRSSNVLLQIGISSFKMPLRLLSRRCFAPIKLVLHILLTFPFCHHMTFWGTLTLVFTKSFTPTCSDVLRNTPEIYY